MQTTHDRLRPPSDDPDGRRRADALDDAFDRLSRYAYVDGPGLATHGPMGAEALSSLGHDDLVAPWVEQYKVRHQVIPAPSRIGRLDPGDESSWRTALGDPSRLSDWAALFAGELQDRPWPEVIAAWVPRLLPGYAGAFTHGLIRTAHAVRAAQTTTDPSPLAVAELAKALAYWAGSYKTLPGRPTLGGHRSLHEAVARLPRPQDPWTPIEAGMFSRIGELRDFGDAVETLGPPASVDEALSDLTSTFARLMLANPDAQPIGLVHAVTPVAGARTLLGYLPTVSIQQMYGQLWQVDAAIAAGFTRAPHSGTATLTDRQDVEAPSPAELVARATEHKDPHVVKFTEACAREHALRADPAYLLAVQHVIDKSPAW
jgi:Questin oxidase-like